MAGIKERRKYFTSINEKSYSPDDTEKRYCLNCESYGFPYQELRERIYQDHELINGQIPHDSELWIQCYRCGKVYPVEHGKQENKLKGFIDIPESIHDSRRLKIEHFITSRKHKARKPIDKTITNALGKIEDDPDIAQKSGQLVDYSDN